MDASTYLCIRTGDSGSSSIEPRAPHGACSLGPHLRMAAQGAVKGLGRLCNSPQTASHMLLAFLKAGMACHVV